jgi:hypothetical protein
VREGQAVVFSAIYQISPYRCGFSIVKLFLIELISELSAGKRLAAAGAQAETQSGASITRRSPNFLYAGERPQGNYQQVRSETFTDTDSI